MIENVLATEEDCEFNINAQSFVINQEPSLMMGNDPFNIDCEDFINFVKNKSFE